MVKTASPPEQKTPADSDPLDICAPCRQEIAVGRMIIRTAAPSAATQSRSIRRPHGCFRTFERHHLDGAGRLTDKHETIVCQCACNLPRGR